MVEGPSSIGPIGSQQVAGRRGWSGCRPPLSCSRNQAAVSIADVGGVVRVHEYLAFVCVITPCLGAQRIEGV